MPYHRPVAASVKIAFFGRGLFHSRVAMTTHKISTLLYCFNEWDEVLLMERAQEPNLGLWSPPGGKLDVISGESPHQCAAREAWEELGLNVSPVEFRLAGTVSEAGSNGAHWLMFLFECRRKLKDTPKPHREGRFAFFSREQVETLKTPATDHEMIWPMFWKHRGGFFAARYLAALNEWTIEEAR